MPRVKRGVTAKARHKKSGLTSSAYTADSTATLTRD